MVESEELPVYLLYFGYSASTPLVLAEVVLGRFGVMCAAVSTVFVGRHHTWHERGWLLDAQRITKEVRALAQKGFTDERPWGSSNTQEDRAKPLG